MFFQVQVLFLDYVFHGGESLVKHSWKWTKIERRLNFLQLGIIILQEFMMNAGLSWIFPCKKKANN